MSSPDEPVPHPDFFRQYAEHAVALHTFVRCMLPRREDAGEVMQDVMIALWRGFQEAREFRPWAFGVARNQALMHLRKRARDRHIFDEELANRMADLAHQQEPRHLTEREALEGCLSKLVPAQRDLVLSAYTKGMRMDELAERRGQTAMSLYKVLHRIRQSLLDCVQTTLAKEEIA
ncbi:MAG TPA: sigma-70 family RNA polymerase sigma factor [Candidatus Saccharimonadia bacterium]|nr:sigma-70 family RNA polymerase sigma factor [Candidatus Saccharimonadia bacterium]